MENFDCSSSFCLGPSGVCSFEGTKLHSLVKGARHGPAMVETTLLNEYNLFQVPATRLLSINLAHMQDETNRENAEGNQPWQEKLEKTKLSQQQENIRQLSKQLS